MTSIAEALDSQTQMGAGLREGLSVLSAAQEVTFYQYRREVLPLDGWIFWLKTSVAVTFRGSLHYAVDLEQRENETIGINHITFTAEEQIQDFDQVAPGLMYIGEFDGKRFGFSKQANFYQQANLYHYMGEAIYPAMLTQIIDNPADLDLADAVVSNSLPIWLTLNQIMPIYPSYLVPQDAVLPYAAVQIGDYDTRALQSAPHLDFEGSHFQLASDRVKITIYGLRNSDALDFQDYVFQYTLNTDNMGIMSMPIIRDGKRVQTELGIIAMEKTIEFEVSYYQSRNNALTRQFILQSLQTYIVNPL